jgi:hypothetical protein
MATMNYNDEALMNIFKATFNKEASVSVEILKDRKIKITVRSLRKDFLTAGVMDALIQTGCFYSKHLC